jgi:hypothetical protein
MLAGQLLGVCQWLHGVRDLEGTGLAKVRRIVSRHGDETSAEVAVDAGATAYFHLVHDGGVMEWVPGLVLILIKPAARSDGAAAT